MNLNSFECKLLLLSPNAKDAQQHQGGSERIHLLANAVRVRPHEKLCVAVPSETEIFGLDCDNETRLCVHYDDDDADVQGVVPMA